MSIPIFYIHKGYCPYLRMSLLQARKANPTARIILLGDAANERLREETGVEYYPLGNYFSLAKMFEKVYRHHSSNGYPYELFCFQRWFILEEFTAKEKLDGYFLYNDSDTFLFCDVNGLVRELVGLYDMSLCGPIAPCFVFFKNRSVLTTYCAFISSQYTDQQNYNFLVTTYQKRLEGQISEFYLMFQTVSDMTMIALYYRQNKNRMIDLCDADVVKQGVFEENHYLGFHDRYIGRFPAGRKIRWKNKQPHYVTYTNTLVPVLGFHFQGHAKREMFKLFRGNRKRIPVNEYMLHQKKYYRFILATCKKRVTGLLHSQS